MQLKFSLKGRVNFEKIVAHGSLSEVDKHILVRNIERKENMIICGTTGSGKTTILEAMIREVACTKKQKNIYVSQFEEMSFDTNDNVYVVKKTNGNVSSSELIKQGIGMGAMYFFIDEIRDKSSLESIYVILRSGGNVVFTIHCSRPSDLVHRITSLYDGDVKKSMKFLAHFDSIIETGIRDDKRKVTLENLDKVMNAK